MATPRKVFMLEDCKHGIDISSAKQFGDVVQLWSNGDRRPSVFRPNDFGAAVLNRLEEFGFDAEQDSFLLTGSLVCVSFALGCLMTTHPRVNILVFSSIEGRYVQRTFDALEMTKIKG